MCVLHVSPSWAPAYGGPPHIVRDLIRVLEPDIESYVAAPAWPVALPTFAVTPNVQLFKSDALARFWAGHSYAMSRAIRALVTNSTLVHVHDLWHYPGFVAIRECLRQGVPYIVSPHGALLPWSLEQKRAKKALYWTLACHQVNSAASIHVLTPTESSAVTERLPGATVTLIPSAVHVPPPPPEPIGGGPLRLLFLGRLHSGKQLPILIRAFAISSARLAGAELRIAGVDLRGRFDGLDALVNELGISKSVEFVGSVEGAEKSRELERADVFVLPSKSEAFPVAALEAMAASCAAILSPACGLNVELAGAGLIIEPIPRLLASAIDRLHADRRQTRAMGQAGRRFVTERYSWSSLRARYLELYEAVVSGELVKSGIGKDA